MTRGKFISIEGTEGAGKSTVLQFIHDFLVRAQQTNITENISENIIMTREPGGTAIAEEIRKVLLYPASTEKMSSLTELLLMFAGRAQHIHHCILPALQAGKWVVSDRFIDASYAYQGGGRKMELLQIQLLDKLVVDDLYPDLTLLLDIPVELGLTRTENRHTKKDRIEQEKIDFFVRVRESYLERAKQDKNRIKIIDASLTKTEVNAQIEDVLTAFMKRN